MNDKELLNIWKSYDDKLSEVLSINKEIVKNITRNNLNDTIDTLKRPKQLMLIIGIPYTMLLCFLTFLGIKSGGLFVAVGFGAISLIMTAIIIGYLYHLHLVKRIRRSREVLDVQRNISELKISSFNLARLAVVQIPFWSICWISLDALISSPFIYGGINLIIFLGLSYVSYWLFRELNIQNKDSKVNQLFLSGMEWEPILKATEILDQLKEYQK